MASIQPCSLCSSSSVSFCPCNSTPLCLTHATQHSESAPEHHLFPIQAFPHRDKAGYLERFQARAESVERGAALLKEGVGLVDRCIHEFEEAVDNAQRRLSEIKETRLGELKKLRDALQRDAEDSIAEAQATLADEEPSLNKPISAALRGAKQLPQFSFKVKRTEVIASIEELLSYRLSEEQKQTTKTEEDIAICPGLFVRTKVGSYISDYNRLQMLGEGSFGKVFLVQQKESGLKRAVKEVSKTNVETKEQRDALIQEVDILAKIDHPNVMKIYELYEDEFKFSIVSELLPGGELFDYLCEQDTLSENFAAAAMLQILSAVNYLHHNGIVHRDLKPENIMLEKIPDSINEFNLKLIDFGLSSVVPSGARLQESLGTLTYMAPEVLNCRYDNKCDLWSVGVILFLMLVGFTPFEGDTEDNVIMNIVMNNPDYDAEQWNYVSDEGISFVKRLLTTDSSKRPSAEEALQDPWIQKFTVARVGEAETTLVVSSLKKFHRGLKLKQAIAGFMASQVLSKEETDQSRDIFCSLDSNHDGFLSREELEAALCRRMPSAEAQNEVQCILKEVDLDSSGRIDYTEFISASTSMCKKMSEEVFERTFRVLDLDHSGKISISELRNVLGAGVTTEKLWAELAQLGDINADGEIDVKEFMKIMQQTS